MVKARDVAEFIRTIVTDLQQEGGETRKGRRLSEEVVAKTVCRHAVKANDALKPAEWDMLLHDLLACDLPYTCPHGRPTMIQLSLAELEKKFGRIAVAAAPRSAGPGYLLPGRAKRAGSDSSAA